MVQDWIGTIAANVAREGASQYLHLSTVEISPLLHFRITNNQGQGQNHSSLGTWAICASRLARRIVTV
jgi:hypothetical protein